MSNSETSAIVETLKDEPFNLRKTLVQAAIWIILVVLLIISAIVSPVFLSPRNIINMLKKSASLGVVAVGQTFVILAGGIDLSVASVMALMSVMAAGMMNDKNNLVLPVSLFCLVVATGIGVFNGVLVTKFKIPPFIATLGTILLVQGIRFVYTGGMPKGTIPDDLRFFGRGVAFLGIPTSVIIWVVVLIIALVVLKRTVFGRQLFAVGGNSKAAEVAGVKVELVTIQAYAICGFLAGVAGLVLTGYIGIADNWLGRGYELDSIAAAAVGGTALTGGKGGVIGSIAGVFIIVILFNLVLLLGLQEETQRIVKGIAILVAVAVYARMHYQS
jgi:ribose/xylose/arabinose/galactoside ABC-type transport system permease subunit